MRTRRRRSRTRCCSSRWTRSSHFAPYFTGLLPMLLKKTKKNASISERSFSVGAIAESMHPLCCAGAGCCRTSSRCWTTCPATPRMTSATTPCTGWARCCCGAAEVSRTHCLVEMMLQVGFRKFSVEKFTHSCLQKWSSRSAVLQLNVFGCS